MSERQKDMPKDRLTDRQTDRQTERQIEDKTTFQLSYQNKTCSECFFFLNVFIQFSTISSHLILLSGTRHVHSLLLFITKIVDSLPGGRCGRVPASGGGGESSL